MAENTASAKEFKDNRLAKTLPLILILLFTAGLYLNSLDNALTYWDDNRYVTENARVRDISLTGIVRIFNPYDILSDKNVSMTEFLPVTTLFHAVAYRVSGLNPVGYHVLNLSLYMLDIVLLYAFLTKAFRDSLAASFSTLAFAVLPFHVESVTWVSATKDVLSFAFLMGSFLLYMRYTASTRGKALFYVLSLALFSLGMLSKTFAVTLPFLLILYDLSFTERGLKIADKVPYLVLGALLSLLYVKTNREYAETVYLTTGIGPYRLFLTIASVLTEYLWMLVYPLNLNAFYYYTPEDIPSSVFRPLTLLSVIIVLSVIVAAVAAFFKRQKTLSFSVLWFFVAFLPAMNLIPSSTLKADRYLFIPSVGFSMLIGWAVAKSSRVGPAVKKAVLFIFGAWVIFMSVLTFQRNAVWQDGITLWKDSIQKDPRNHRPYFILGNEYRHRGMNDEAIEAYLSALEINPNHLLACNNLGAMYGVRGEYARAAAVLRRCIEIGPTVEARLNLARAYLAMGERGKAVEELREVLRADPGNEAALSMLGM